MWKKLYLLPHLEVCCVIFEMLLHTHTELVHPLPLSLQRCTVSLITCREMDTEGRVFVTLQLQASMAATRH